jgi:nucleotidyltransferase AbiEii toxin of type IV toxin-antitoxin system
MEMMLDAVGQSYHGLSFRFDRDKDWYFTDNSLAANPVCTHAGNEKGVNVRLEVSLREKPILPVRVMPQIAQDYFKFLPFGPAGIPSLTYEEAVAEKIRAASQRSKIRDLHDLSEVAGRPLNRRPALSRAGSGCKRSPVAAGAIAYDLSGAAPRSYLPLKGGGRRAPT